VSPRDLNGNCLLSLLCSELQPEILSAGPLPAMDGPARIQLQGAVREPSMDDNGRWRAIRVRAIRVELRSTAVDPSGSNDLSNLLSGSNVRSVPIDELQSATMVATSLNVQILLNCRLALHLGHGWPPSDADPLIL
jgi:hypothetical protein